MATAALPSTSGRPPAGAPAAAHEGRRINAPPLWGFLYATTAPPPVTWEEDLRNSGGVPLGEAEVQQVRARGGRW